jgi:hypothetical protein
VTPPTTDEEQGMRRIAALVVAGLAGLGVVAGCGGNSHNPSTVATSYFHDLGNQNYSNACKLLTADLRRQLGDCSSTLRKHHGGLPFSTRDDLRNVSIRSIHTKNGAGRVISSDATVTRTVKDRNGKSHITRVRSGVAVSQATGGQGLQLTEVGKDWYISGGV